MTDISELVEKYDLFREHFFFECGNGWYDLINSLCEYAIMHASQNYTPALSVRFVGVRVRCGVMEHGL